MGRSKSSTAQWEGKGVIGMDLGNRRSWYFVLTDLGEIVDEGKVEMTQEALEEFFARWSGAELVIETGTHSLWVERLAREAGLEVIVADARKLQLITRSRRKTDRRDAQWLAELGLTGRRLLAPIQPRSRRAQQKRAEMRAREALVTTRTKLINTVRSLAKGEGCWLPKCSAESFAKQVRPVLPAELRETLEPLLRMIQQATDDLKRWEKQLEEEAAADPVIECLRQVDGVGVIVATMYRWTIDDPQRFRNSRDVAAYLGLVPGCRQSGEREQQLGITKTGDGLMRRLLLQSAAYILGPFGKDCDLRRWGLAKLEQLGEQEKKRVQVAVARRLAVLLHRLWVHEANYDPFYQAKRQVA